MRCQNREATRLGSGKDSIAFSPMRRGTPSPQSLSRPGVNPKALSTYMGHATIQITFDRYGHLMPGNEAESSKQLDAYLLRAMGHSGASPTPTGADLSDPERSGVDAAFEVVEPETA